MSELESLHAELELEDLDGELSEAEVLELRSLLGLYDCEGENRLPPGRKNRDYVRGRHMYWGRRREHAPRGSVEYAVVDQTYTRYGLILAEILDESGEATVP